MTAPERAIGRRLTRVVTDGTFCVQIGDFRLKKDRSVLTVETSDMMLTVTDESGIDLSARRIVLIGPSGCGKGTQAALLRDLLGISPEHHLSVGDMLRRLMDGVETPPGRAALDSMGISPERLLEDDQVIRVDPRSMGEIEASRKNSANRFTGRTSSDWLKYAVENGRLLPDRWTEALIESVFRADDMKDEFILDGYPRTEKAARELVALFRRLRIEVDRVVVLHVPDFEVQERLLRRKRRDDTEEAVRSRIDFYHQHVEPAIHYLQKALGHDKVHFIGYRVIFDPDGGLDVHASIAATFDGLRPLFANKSYRIDVQSEERSLPTFDTGIH